MPIVAGLKSPELYTKEKGDHTYLSHVQRTNTLSSTRCSEIIGETVYWPLDANKCIRIEVNEGFKHN